MTPDPLRKALAFALYRWLEVRDPCNNIKLAAERTRLFREAMDTLHEHFKVSTGQVDRNA